MQDIDVRYNLDLDEFFKKMDLVSNRLGTVEDSLTGLKSTNPFVAANQSAQQLNTTLSTQGQIYQKIQATAEAFRQEQTRLKQIYAELKSKQAEFIAAGRYQELTAQLDLVKGRLAELKKGFPEITDEVEKLGKAGKSGSGGGIKGLVSELTTAISISFGVAEGMKLMVTESAKFGKGLSQLSALTGVTGKDLQFLADAAVDLETKTGIAASDIVEGFKLVGGIKPELLESKEALASVTEEVVALAQASGESLQDSATAAVGALNQFGEGADQAGRFVNVLAAGAKVGASEVRDTSEALKASGTAMKAAGLSFEEGNALIQSLAGVMIKGSEAGTALRNVILKLETDADKNLRPSIVGLDKALENAAAKYDTTTELTKVFGQENIVAARRILDTRGEIQKLTKDLTGTDTAYEQQRINLDNLSTDLDKLGTSFKGFFRELGDSQGGFLRFAIQSFTSFLTQLSSKTGEYRAFLRGFVTNFTGNVGMGIENGIAEYQRQQQANAAAASARAQNDEVRKVANQTVNSSITSRTNALVGSGIKKDDAAVQAAQEALSTAQDKLIQVRKQYNETASQLRTANTEQRKQLIQDGKLDALAIKQARENVAVATSALNRAKKDQAGRAAALRSALNEPLTADQKKAGKDAQKAAEDNYKLLLSAQDEYVKEYQKLEEQFGKDKLESLKKDQNAYILEQARLDKEELDAREAYFLRKLQLAAAKTTAINKLTGVREPVANTAVQLPADVKAQFDARRKEIDAEADRQIRINKIRQQAELIGLEKQTNETELKLFDAYWEERLLKEGKNSQLLLALIKKRDSDRNALVQDQLIRDQKAQEQISLSNIQLRVKGKDQTGAQFNRQNQLDEIATQTVSAENQIYGLTQQNDPKNTPEIKRLEAFVKALKDKRKEIELLGPVNRDIWDLLGVSKSFKDEAERQAFTQATELIKNAFQETTQVAIQASEERIAALDQQIQAKEEQIRIEEERDKEGYANNKALREAELADLKRQKAEEEATKRKALAAQQTLDLASVVSNNAVTVSNLISASAKAFDKAISSTFNPILGVVLAIGAIATIFATVAAVTAKAKSITKLRKGGRLNGPSHEHGGIRGTGAFSDIEIEGGEHVTNAESSDRFDKTLEALNLNDPRRAFLALLKEGGIGLPSAIIQHMTQPGFSHQSPIDFSTMERHLSDMNDRLSTIERHTKPRKQQTALGNNRILETDGTKETIRTIK